MKIHWFILTFSLYLLTAGARGQFEVTETTTATSESTGATIVQGKVALPAAALWLATHVYEEKDGLIEVYLAPDESAIPQGRRAGKLQDLRDTRERMYRLSYLFNLAQNHARDHDGIGPGSWEDVIKANPERKFDAQTFGGTRLVPNVRMLDKEGDEMRVPDQGEPLIFDTTPAIDDGRHWVVDSRGEPERRPIDAALMSSLNVTIQPGRKPFDDAAADAETPIPHTIMARIANSPGAATVPLRDVASGKTTSVVWDLSQARPGDDAICRRWADLRRRYLEANRGLSIPLVNATWMAITSRQYGLPGESASENAGPSGRTAGAMNVLGGRAAIQETLQLQDLDVNGTEAAGESTVPVDAIPGVEIEAHPFQTMLASQAGGRLALADWVPSDHFMAYVPQTRGLFSLLEGGTDFIFTAGSTLTGRSVAHRLKKHYLEALGLSESLMEQFLKTGAIEEMALVIPDLFLIDGTELSVVARTGRPLLTTTALALVGVPPGNGTTVKQNAHGESVYWYRQDSMLVISTDKRELDAILAAKADGTGLGQSAELRYMLTRVPVTAETAVYLYFSDPFIRHLVSPKTKIAQLRRMRGRTDLEQATAGALLATFDGHGEQPSGLTYLRERGYVRKPVIAHDLTLDADGRSHSATYGTAPRLRSLTKQEVNLVTPEERRAYERYLEEYNHYWRRFFDPIAIRYDQKESGQHEIETFILPLIDNSLYATLREFLPAESESLPLQVPVMTPEPIAVMSLNLREEAWLELIENFSPQIDQFLGLDSAVLDLLGPDIHLAVQDADPILSMGNGEIDAIFGRFGGGMNSDMFWLPVAVSMFTRPCTIHLGLQDPEKVLAQFREMALRTETEPDGRRNSFGMTTLYKITGEDRWILKFSIEDLITLRFGIEIQDRYLVINNMPFSNPVSVTGSEEAPNQSAYLRFHPAACVKQLGALHASAAEANRSNALSGAASLLPLLVSGSEDVRAAQQRHLELFGFEPLHPAGGSWQWEDNELVSTLYGSVWRREQPAFDPADEGMGILRKVERLGLSMQFEDDGLRSTVRWHVKH